METTPLISQTTVKQFIFKFKGAINSPERKMFEDLRKPDICGTIVSAEYSRHHWFKENDLKANINRVKKKKLSIYDNGGVCDEIPDLEMNIAVIN